jgi:large subunit ribosomal protein L10
MFREQKEQVVSQMKADMQRAEVALFVDFTGLTVAEVDLFRSRLREADVSYRVIKNTLMKHAVAGTEYESAGQWFKGTPTGVIIGFEDPVAPAKVTYEFLKECEHLTVKGGVMDNKAITAQEVEALSKMPSREEMQAQIVGMITGVAGGLISQIKSPAGRIVGAVEAKAESSEAA